MATPSHSAGGWRFLLRALRHPNYRLFFCGQSLSLIGTWMSRIVIGWLVYSLKGSAWMLGVIAFLDQIPSFVLVPFAGVWIERWSRHRALIWINALLMLQSLTLAALAFSGRITLWQVAALTLLQGILNALDTPARQTFLVEMLEGREDLPNAVGLNAAMLTVARLIGPAAGGLIIASFGVAWCFTVDGISYGAVIVSLVLMHVAAAPPRCREKENLWRELGEGFGYISGSVPIRALLLMLAVVSLVGMPYAALLPLFAHKILHGGPRTLGLLMSSAGSGALIAAVGLAASRSVAKLSRNIGLSALLFAASIVVFGFSRNLGLSVAMLFLAGFAMMQLSATVNTILQIIAEPPRRGRVMGYFTMAFMGMMPFGSLLGGAAASRFGAPHALACSGVLCALAAVVYFAVLPGVGRALEKIYAEVGVLAPAAPLQESAIPLVSDSAAP